MPTRRSTAVTASAFLLALTAAGAAGAGEFTIELNDALEIEDGCRVVYVAFNGTGTALERTSYDVYTFDADGRVAQSLVFQFGSFPVDKTKVMQFDLPGQGCDEISRLLVNEVTECVTEDGPSDICLDALKTTTRTAIAFGL